MKMLNPAAAAQWLSERLGRPVSRQTIQIYISAGDLPATNVGAGGQRAHWIVNESDLETFASRAVGDRLPQPTGGWPQRASARKEKRSAED